MSKFYKVSKKNTFTYIYDINFRCKYVKTGDHSKAHGIANAMKVTAN